MEMKEGRYVSHIWFASSRKRNLDWLAFLFRDPGEDWHIEWRFRYYKDAVAHDSEDEKSWHEFSVPRAEPEAKVVAGVDLIASAVKAHYQGELGKVRVESDLPQVALERLQSQPWAHLKIEDLAQ